MATILASIVVAVAKSPAAVIGGQGLIATQTLRYSRLYETEADREGFLTLQKSGYQTKKCQKCLKICKKLEDYLGIIFQNSYLRTL